MFDVLPTSTDNVIIKLNNTADDVILNVTSIEDFEFEDEIKKNKEIEQENNTNNLLFMANMFKKLLFQQTNSNQTTAIQQFVKQFIYSFDENIVYKCNFIEIKHCKIIDGIIYTFISVTAVCIFGLVIFMLHNLYKCLSIYNNYREAKKVFLDLESKI